MPMDMYIVSNTFIWHRTSLMSDISQSSVKTCSSRAKLFWYGLSINGQDVIHLQIKTIITWITTPTSSNTGYPHMEKTVPEGVLLVYRPIRCYLQNLFFFSNSHWVLKEGTDWRTEYMAIVDRQGHQFSLQHLTSEESENVWCAGFLASLYFIWMTL